MDWADNKTDHNGSPQPDSWNAAKCPHDGFWCHVDEMCVPNFLLCDNVTDCAGGEDEAYCSGRFFDRKDSSHVLETVLWLGTLYTRDLGPAN